MNTRGWWIIIIILAGIIAVLTWLLVSLPASGQAPATATSTQATSTGTAVGSTTTGDTTAPLHTRVVVTSPRSGATVESSFFVSGDAPGNWYFEASFPIQVRDANNNKLGQAIAQAQSDWMTTAQVPFTATMTLDGSYHGPATLVLLRDNASGLPENDDSLEIPIVIQ